MLALASHLVHALPGAGELCPAGPLEVGQRVRLPGIARTLRAIAHDGRAAFYEGEFGRGLLGLGAGHFAPSDLAISSATWCTPLRLAGLGPRAVDGAATVAGLPDPGRRVGGRGVRARARPRRSPVGPPRSSRRGAPWATTALRCSSTGPRVTRCSPQTDWPPRPPGSTRTGRGHPTSRRGREPWARGVARMGEGDTTHLCALDADGLGVSLTQSNALDFGSHLIEPTTGVFLHNRGVGFSLVAGHPAEIAPGRRPPAHPLPHARHGAGRFVDASRRCHGRRRPAADHRPAAGAAAVRRAGPGRRRRARPGSPSTHPPPGPSDCGGVTTSPCWSSPTRPRHGPRA